MLFINYSNKMNMNDFQRSTNNKVKKICTKNKYGEEDIFYKEKSEEDI